jgi:AcrR family transcriptional regulator
MTKPINHSLQHRKETILMIAEEVFAQYSFAGATIRLITERSGVNSAMISYYFGSKKRFIWIFLSYGWGKLLKRSAMFEASLILIHQKN